MKVYHGSNMEVTKPDIVHSYKALDFGQGFYVTTVIEQAIRWANERGFLVIVITNQSGVARGYFSEDDVHRLHEWMNEDLARFGAHIDAFYYCPHLPNGSVVVYAKECDCRKPKPGLFLQAGKDFDADFGRSFMIGDKISDLQAAFAAGCSGGALVMTGHGKEQEIVKLDREYKIVGNILEAVDRLLETTEQTH